MTSRPKSERRGPYALINLGILSDPKFRKLARQLPDPDDFNSAFGAYVIAILAARRNGSPEIDVDDETETRFGPQLRAVELVIPDGFPPAVFDRYAPGPPVQVARAGGRARAAKASRDAKGHMVKADPDPPVAPSHTQQAAGLPSSHLDSPSRVQPHPAGAQLEPATPSRIESIGIDSKRFENLRVPTTESARGAEGNPAAQVRLTAAQLEDWRRFSAPMWTPFAAAWLDRGFRLPPKPEVQVALFEAADNQPRRLGEWVSLAPPASTSFEVIAFVLERWHEFRGEALQRAALEEAEADARKIRERYIAEQSRPGMASLAELVAAQAIAPEEVS